LLGVVEAITVVRNETEYPIVLVYGRGRNIDVPGVVSCIINIDTLYNIVS
jgi:hypothetical protein